MSELEQSHICYTTRGPIAYRVYRSRDKRLVRKVFAVYNCDGCEHTFLNEIPLDVISDADLSRLGRHFLKLSRRES